MDSSQRNQVDTGHMNSGTGLSGRTVIVTGAGGGIGRATALRFINEQARVVVADADGGAADAVVDELRAAGGQAVAVIGDLTDADVIAHEIDVTVESFGTVDVVVNNAGVVDGMHAAGDLPEADWERVLQVNLTAPFLLTKAALPHMLAQGRGAFVNVTSEAGLRGSAAGTAYTVSKHGLVGLTRSVAVQYRNAGIRCNAIAPGLTQPSNVSAHRVGSVDKSSRGIATLTEYGASAGRVAVPDEQASAIVFLASDWASDISGVVLPVDNGWSAV
jgi:NAD(P)-dependent dehydrogenase (short-subunit alcohol dehydrogenase family)